MDHAITIGDLLRWMVMAGGVFGALWIVGYVVLVLLNPFSSGH